MIRTFALIKRREDVSRAAFREHYESTHAPLALPLMRGLVRYVRYHFDGDAAEVHGSVGCDVFSAFGYRDAESVTASMNALAGEAGKPILADEAKFMDKPSNRFFSVSETCLVEGDEGDAHLFVLVRKPESITRADCSARLLRRGWPKLLDRFRGVEFALARDAFPVRQASSSPQTDDPLPWNALLQVRAAEDASLSAWAEPLEADGYRVAAVRTHRFETERRGP